MSMSRARAAALWSPNCHLSHQVIVQCTAVTVCVKNATVVHEAAVVATVVVHVHKDKCSMSMWIVPNVGHTLPSYHFNHQVIGLYTVLNVIRPAVVRNCSKHQANSSDKISGEFWYYFDSKHSLTFFSCNDRLEMAISITPLHFLPICDHWSRSPLPPNALVGPFWYIWKKIKIVTFW